VVIVGTIFRQKFADVYSTRQALLNAIYAKAKSLVDAAQGSGSLSRPIELWPNLAGQTVVTISDGMEGATALRMAVQASANDGVYHPVDTSRKYKTRFWARAAAGTDGVLFFDLRQFLDSAGTPCATNIGRSPYYPSGVAAHTGWVFYEHTWQGSDFQSGVKFVQPEYLGNYAGTTGYWEIQGFRWFDVTEVDAAQTAASSAQTGVNTINDPDTLTTGEKPQIILDYNAITSENADLVAKANSYSVDHSTYDAAYSALMSYLGTLTSPTAWNSLSGTTSLGTGNRVALWNPKWAAVKNAAADLRNAIAVGTAQNAISTAATDATNKANAAQLASQPHQVGWAYGSKPALPDPAYPPGYYAITTDSRTVQVNPAGTAWTDVLVATTGLFGQLFASQLVIGGMGTRLNLDPTFLDPSFWTVTDGTWVVLPNSSAPVGGTVAVTDTSVSIISKDYIPIDYRKKYRLAGWLDRDPAANGVCYLGLQLLDSDGVNITGNGTYFYLGIIGVAPPANNWTRYTGTLGPGCDLAIPANAKTARMVALLNYGGTVGNVYLSGLTLEEQITGDLIVDGTLQALVERVPLLYSLDMRSGSDASGYQMGAIAPNTGAAPSGFRISANGFTANCYNGDMTSNNASGVQRAVTVQAEFGIGVSIGGYYVGDMALGRLVNGGTKTFAAGTSGTWVCPPGIKRLNVLMVGGGGGCAWASSTCMGGGQGGGSLMFSMDVTPGNSYSYSVGSGGAFRNATTNGSATSGGNTTFGGFLACGGAGGGISSGKAYGGSGGGPNQVNGNNLDWGGTPQSGWLPKPVSGIIFTTSLLGTGGGQEGDNYLAGPAGNGFASSMGGSSGYGQGGDLYTSRGSAPGIGGGGGRNAANTSGMSGGDGILILSW
jgi:hypothetical protein